MRSVDNVGVPLLVIANKQVSIFLKKTTTSVQKSNGHLYMIFLSIDASKNFLGTVMSAKIHKLGDTWHCCRSH